MGMPAFLRHSLAAQMAGGGGVEGFVIFVADGVNEWANFSGPRRSCQIWEGRGNNRFEVASDRIAFFCDDYAGEVFRMGNG